MPLASTERICYSNLGNIKEKFSLELQGGRTSFRGEGRRIFPVSMVRGRAGVGSLVVRIFWKMRAGGT